MRIPNLLAPPNKALRYVIISLAFVMYLGVFFRFHHAYGTVITSLALFPVVLGSWYFGVAGGYSRSSSRSPQTSPHCSYCDTH